MDELEKHIKNNREGMDIHSPDPGLWSRIENDLPRRQLQIGTLLWKAAAILIIAAAGLSVIIRTLQIPGKYDRQMTTEVKETYRYYNTQIQSLYHEAEPLLTSNPDISRELTDGMNKLDRLSVQIIEDLNDNVASSEVVEALIQNYRLRIELLEDMLNLMREQQTENENITDHEI